MSHVKSRCLWTVLCLSLALAPAAALRAADDTKTATTEATWGQIEIKGSYPEAAEAPGLFGDLTESLAGTLARFDKAAADPKLNGLILKINSPKIGWGKLNALRQGIAKVRGQGKKVHAYLDSASNMDYLLASACDTIVMPESGVVMVLGLRAEVSFYKNLFDLVGVKAEMLRVGEFKSAAEPYSRTEMSPEFRMEMEELLDDYYAQMVKLIAESRKLDPEKVKAAIDNGPQTAQEAKELGLIDRVAYEDQLEASLKEEQPGAKIVPKFGKKKVDTDFSGFAGMVKFMELLTGTQPTQRKTSTPRIAIIQASGAITTGKSSSDLFGSTSLGSETLIKAIQEANKDDLVKAIVLRIDSPGGSALASDLIWRELERVEKPFVVSMGDVAASGGYYIAMGADRIFAEPGTLTGSIGVVGGKLALEGLYGKVGITTSIITRGKNAGVMSSTTPFTESEREAMQRMLNAVYDQFTTKAAAGRKMDKEKLEKLARGRVYTGTMALKIGLVDEIGSLEDAIAAAQKLAGLKPEDKLDRLILPKAVSPLEALFGPIDASARSQTQQTAALRAVLQNLSPELAGNLQALQVLNLFTREGAVAIMPYHLQIK